jgi:hypothetical protein
MSIKSLILEIWRIVTKDTAALQEKVKLQDAAIVKASKVIAHLIGELDDATQTIEKQNEEALKYRAEIRRKSSHLLLNIAHFQILPKKMPKELHLAVLERFNNRYCASWEEYYDAVIELSPEIEGEIILPKEPK